MTECDHRGSKRWVCVEIDDGEMLVAMRPMDGMGGIMSRSVVAVEESVLLKQYRVRLDGLEAAVDYACRERRAAEAQVEAARVREQIAKDAASAARVEEQIAKNAAKSIAEAAEARGAARLSERLREAEERLDDLLYLREVRQHGCECSDEDACAFARARDAAIARAEEAEAARKDCAMYHMDEETHRAIVDAACARIAARQREADVRHVAGWERGAASDTHPSEYLAAQPLVTAQPEGEAE